jgi:hypothetical protein
MPLDIGVGFLLGVLLNGISGLSYGWCLAIGVGACLLPDIDYVLSFIKNRKQPDTRHRDLLHYPLLLLPMLSAVMLVDNNVGLILVLGSFLHFVHDSFGVGFGLKWLYPFKKNSYLFFFQASTPNNRDMPKKFLYSWNDEERDVAIKKYGYADWIKHVYFRFHRFGFFEYAIFLVGLVAAVAHA